MSFVSSAHFLNKYCPLSSVTREDLEWLRELPYTISIPSLDALVVHAGLVPNVVLEMQEFGDMHSMRNLVSETVEVIAGSIGTSANAYSAVSSATEGVAWASVWAGRPHVYFGHDAKRGLQQYEHATGLDTGCCYGECLVVSIVVLVLIRSFSRHREETHGRGAPFAGNSAGAGARSLRTHRRPGLSCTQLIALDVLVSSCDRHCSYLHAVINSVRSKLT